MKLFNALRSSGSGKTDAMRQTTSLTMAYLLEQNRHFESYMRAKVEELEARVAAQQARTSVKVDEDAVEVTSPAVLVAALRAEPQDEALDETRPTGPVDDDTDLFSFLNADFGPDEADEFGWEEETGATLRAEPASPGWGASDEAPQPEPVETGVKANSGEASAADAFNPGLYPGGEAEEAPDWANWEAALIGAPVEVGLPEGEEMPPNPPAEAPVEADEPGEAPAAGEIEATAGTSGSDLPVEPGETEGELSDSFLPPWLQAGWVPSPAGEDEVPTAAMPAAIEDITDPEVVEARSSDGPANEAEMTPGIEDDDMAEAEAEVTLPLTVGSVKEWA